MFSERHRDDAVLLDEIWDGIVGNKPAVTSPQQLLEAIRYLEAGAPMMSASQRDRIRAKVQFPSTASGSRASGNTVTLDAAPLPVNLPIARRRRLDHPVLQIAATILLLIGIAGAWFVTRPNDAEHQSSPGIVAGSPSPEVEQPPTLALVYVPSTDEPQNLFLRIRRIVLAPGTRWERVDSSGESDGLFIDRGLVSGRLEVEGANGFTTTVDEHSNPGTLRGLTGANPTITNIGDTNAILIELSAWISTQTNPQIFPYEGAPELPVPPAGSTSEYVGGTDYITLSNQDSTFMLSNPTGLPVGPTWVGTASFQTIFGVIEFGTFNDPNGPSGDFGLQGPEASPVQRADHAGYL